MLKAYWIILKWYKSRNYPTVAHNLSPKSPIKSHLIKMNLSIFGVLVTFTNANPLMGKDYYDTGKILEIKLLQFEILR